MRRRRYGWEFWGFTPGRRSRFFESGEVRLALLSLLSEGPKHGYQLMKELEERSGGMYKASAGTIYPTLQMLEDEGLVAVERENGKRVYRITDDGSAELEREQERVERIWRRAEHWQDWGQFSGPEIAALAGPLGRVAKAAFKAMCRADGREDREDRIREILSQARRDLERV